VSFGARVIVPESSIETPRASPFMISAREFTDQIVGDEALARLQRNNRSKKTLDNFFIGLRMASSNA